MNSHLKNYVLAVILLLAIPIAYAGLFGTSNFEECVLEKMKGQQPNLLGTARDACRIAYPLPPKEIQIKSEKIKWEWCDVTKKSHAVCVLSVPKNVSLTKVIGDFFYECKKPRPPSPKPQAQPKPAPQNNSSSKKPSNYIDEFLLTAVPVELPDFWWLREPDVKIEVAKSILSNKFVFNTSAEQFKCTEISFYGFEK
jgi:hypothetical protein